MAILKGTEINGTLNVSDNTTISGNLEAHGISNLNTPSINTESVDVIRGKELAALKLNDLEGEGFIKSVSQLNGQISATVSSVATKLQVETEPTADNDVLRFQEKEALESTDIYYGNNIFLNLTPGESNVRKSKEFISAEGNQSIRGYIQVDDSISTPQLLVDKVMGADSELTIQVIGASLNITEGESSDVLYPKISLADDKNITIRVYEDANHQILGLAAKDLVINYTVRTRGFLGIGTVDTWSKTLTIPQGSSSAEDEISSTWGVTNAKLKSDTVDNRSEVSPVILYSNGTLQLGTKDNPIVIYGHFAEDNPST